MFRFSFPLIHAGCTRHPCQALFAASLSAVLLLLMALTSVAAQESTPTPTPTPTPTQTTSAPQASAMRVRGVISSLDGAWLTVLSREGLLLRIRLDDKLVVSTVKAIRFADIRPGDFMGVTAMKRNDGTLVALEVHTLPPTAAAGFTPWDLQPGATMTNATVMAATAQSAGTQADGSGELLMDYKSGSHRISVPAGTPIVAAQPGERAMLRAGEWVFLVAQVAADGGLSVGRVTVGRDGVRPPQ